MTVNVLGTEYTVTVKKYKEDKMFEKRSICGYHDGFTKEIVICDPATFPGWEDEKAEYIEASRMETLRHEIVHAFLYESGLDDSSATCDVGWSKFEEMVDWIAIQGPKIYAAWQAAGAL